MTRVIWLSLFVLLANNALAQRGGASGVGHGGVGRGGFRPGFGRGGFLHGGFRQVPLRGSFLNGGFRFNRGLAGYPYGFGWFGYPGDFLPDNAGTEHSYPARPTVVIVQQPALPQVNVQEPARPVEPIIHEYGPPAPNAVTAYQGESPTFGIVLKDGSSRSALAVVIDNNVLKYVDPEERNLQVPLDQVDREATRKLNRARNLSFWLPASP